MNAKQVICLVLAAIMLLSLVLSLLASTIH